MNISHITNKIEPILKLNHKNLHEDIKDPHDRLVKLFNEMEILVDKSQDLIDLSEACKVLKSADVEENLKAQVSRISTLAHEKIRSTHMTFLSQKTIEKSYLGYFEFLWSSGDLLTENPRQLSSKKDKKLPGGDLTLPVDIESLSEHLARQFLVRPPSSVIMRTFSSIFRCLGLTAHTNPQILQDSKALTKQILNEILLFMKYDDAPDFSFLDKKDPLAVQLLFSTIDYLGVANLQKKYLEPFNKKFPEIPLDKAPQTIFSLNFEDQDVTRIDFSLFPYLEEVKLSFTQNLTPAQISQIPASVKKLNLSGCNVAGVNFSRFKDLEELDLSHAQNLTPEQIKQIPASIKRLNLASSNVIGFKLSRFKDLEELDLSFAQNLIPDQISQISASIKRLRLGWYNVARLNFSHLTHLEELYLYSTKNFTSEQREELPAGCKIYEL